MTTATLEYDLTRLEQRHRFLDETIKKAYSTYLSDEHLSKMKQEKLYVKRQIDSIKNRVGI